MRTLMMGSTTETSTMRMMMRDSVMRTMTMMMRSPMMRLVSDGNPKTSTSG